ncbi:hypothetical protein [Methylomonas sp. AM2-LC]|uniref:hypothetical protein n=1 Tax=Methylomonas sp. AM2-LC TaxID=3153301 RepID=UPI003266D6C6
MNNRTKVYETVLLLVGLIYAWPKSQVNIHPEETSLSFDADTHSWLLTISEELSSGIIVSLLICLVYAYYCYQYRNECKKSR